MIRLLGAVCAFALLVCAVPGTAERAGSHTTAIQVEAIGPPQHVHGSDGREHVEFDLTITNSFTAEVTLTSLVVRGGGRELLALSGEELAAAILPFGGGAPTASIPASSTVVAYVDLVLPRSGGRAVPKRLRNRITYTLPPDAPVEAITGSRTVRGPELRLEPRAPIVIAPPLRGPGWASANACCDDLSLNHRTTILSANGTYVAPETFSVDYVRVVDGRFYEGDGTENADWFGYGAPVRAATSGRVVTAIDDRPEVPPFTTNATNPTVTKPSEFGGNGVVIKVRRGVFAHYYHLQPGSVRVEVGERVRTGLKLGRFGNSGNTDGPHLHFGFTESRSPLASASIAFEIDRFRFEGVAATGPAPGEILLTGKPRMQHRSHPLATSVSDYTRR